MPIYKWAIFAENAIIDNQSNNISLINIIEQIKVLKVPIVIPQQYCLATLWEKERSFSNNDEIFHLRVIITHHPRKIDPKEGVDAKLRIPSDKKRIRHLFRIRGIPIKEEKPLYIIGFVKNNNKFIKKFIIKFDIIIDK